MQDCRQPATLSPG